MLNCISKLNHVSNGGDAPQPLIPITDGTLLNVGIRMEGGITWKQDFALEIKSKVG